MNRRRSFLIASSCALAMLAGAADAQQPYPGKPIRIIVPYAAGGSVDTLARTINQKLGEGLGQPVIVENKPGGSASIGSDALVKSPPDGYTLMLTAVDHVIIPQLMQTPFDPLKDFAPVSGVSFSSIVLVVHPSVQANTLQELIALAKAKPEAFNYATSGSGGIPHLTGELFNRAVGTKIQHVPYKGGGPAMVDLIGGQVQMAFAIPIGAIPHIKTGKIKPIAITGSSRLDQLPDVPTFTESGVPGFEVKVWWAMFAPAGTPKPIVDRIAAEIRKVLASPEIKDKLRSQGMEAYTATPEELGEVMKADFAKYGAVIRERNIKMEN